MIVRNSKQLLLKIKTIITEKELQKQEVADKLNISSSALYSRLNHKNITIDSLIEICDALDLDMDVEFIKKDNTK
jgi:DNA-binding Xre family transcriptional regulator|nr:MAG TPA: SOS-response transcriptional repressor [Caudoviricetes sp.]